MPKDLYETLGVRPTASVDAIKKAYRKLVKRYHPDLNRHRGASEMFLEVKEAYEVLSNPLLRREYDERSARGRLERPAGSGRAPAWSGTPRKVRVPQDYIHVSAPFRGYRDRIATVQDRNLSRRTRSAQAIWRLYVVSVVSMSSTLALFGTYVLAMGATFQGAITLGASGMMLVVLFIAWLAKGLVAPDL